MNRLAKHENEKRNARIWTMRDSIALEVSPVVMANQVEFETHGNGPSKRTKGRPVGSVGGQAKETVGRGKASFEAHGYSVADQETDFCLQDNCPIMAMGIAMSERDNSTK